MKIKRNIALSDSGFVFNPTTGDSFSTNPIGLEIIRLLKEDKDAEQVKKHVIQHYMTDEVTFEKDYYDFVNMLTKLQLIEADDNQAQD
ncbi:MAG TPA: PqqD family protein [Bacteroidia bacterium]|nr:PqqD family protein [Bacteroidia bacterium]